MELRVQVKIVHFTPQGRPLSSHATGCSVGPAMHVVVKNKITVLARNQTQLSSLQPNILLSELFQPSSPYFIFLPIREVIFEYIHLKHLQRIHN
jgi:hypothetical protein